MKKKDFNEICFQCGKPRILVREYTEYVNNAPVVTTESICSDPDCQKRTMDAIAKEMLKRNQSNANKQNRFASKK